jgi:diacylglycerol O-acyltransferase / wax synthase
MNVPRTTGSSIDRLTALDRLMLGASRIWPQDIGAIVLLDGTYLLEPDGRFRIDIVRHAVGSRLHLVPRLRQVVQVPRPGLGGPLWIDAPAFDIDDHVRVRPLPAGTDEAGLLAATEQLRCQRLDPSRPLWEMWFMPGLPNGRVAMFLRLHHCIADGMAAMATISALLDPAADTTAPAAPPWRPGPWPPARELLADNLGRHIRALAGAALALIRPQATTRRLVAVWRTVRDVLTGEPGPDTSLDRTVGPDRAVILIRSTLDRVKQVAQIHHATVNDVLLAATAGGLRALLVSRGEPVEGLMVPIYVPVSLRRRVSGPPQGNLIAQMVVPLPVGVSDPGDRLRRIAAITAERKAQPHTSLDTLFRGRIARLLMLKAVARQRVNVTSASIPGPAAPLYLAGARVLEVFAVLPLIANEPLGVGGLSYAGMFTIGVVADREAYPDLDVFAAGVRADLRDLGSVVKRDDDVGSAPLATSEGRR